MPSLGVFLLSCSVVWIFLVRLAPKFFLGSAKRFLKLILAKGLVFIAFTRLSSGKEARLPCWLESMLSVYLMILSGRFSVNFLLTMYPGDSRASTLLIFLMLSLDLPRLLSSWLSWDKLSRESSSLAFFRENGESARRLSRSPRVLFVWIFLFSKWNADNFVVLFDPQISLDIVGIGWGRMSDSGVFPTYGLRNPELKSGVGHLFRLGLDMGGSWSPNCFFFGIE